MITDRYWKAIYLDRADAGLRWVLGSRLPLRQPHASPPATELHSPLVPGQGPAATQATKDPAQSSSPSQDLDATSSEALNAFLLKFDSLSEQGFVSTLRSGSTGIGYTLETMLDIEENNSPGGDFMGMELKAFRDDDLAMDDSEKMNLFLKEPHWIDGLKGQATRSEIWIR